MTQKSNNNHELASNGEAMKQFRSLLSRRSLARHLMTPTFATYSLRSEPTFSLDPFLNLDEFVMSMPTFPPHPHAGFSAVTYMFEDSEGAFKNRDSLGDESRIEAGGIHWTQAARGMMHEETPEQPGLRCHGLQMFVNLRDEHKQAPPVAYHVSPKEVPEVQRSPGVRVRVLAGTFDGIQSPLKALLTPITFLEVHLAPDAQVDVDAPRAHNSFVMIVRGSGTVADVAVEEHEALLFAHDADRVSLRGGSKGMQLLFGEGAPLDEPVVFGGPFVMTRTSDIHDARQRFLRGEMGRLEASTNSSSQ